MPRARRSFRVGKILLTLALFAAGMFFFQGRVVSIADGDTLSVFGKDARTHKVRLYGIDCPESAQPGGDAARALTGEKALFSEVGLTVLDTDHYGRAVALVTLPDGRSLNEELLRAGLAWVYRDFCTAPFCATWMVMEAEARAAKRGLWQDPNPIPPWRWRRDMR